MQHGLPGTPFIGLASRMSPASGPGQGPEASAGGALPAPRNPAAGTPSGPGSLSERPPGVRLRRLTPPCGRRTQDTIR
jgi:hypothetical protein